MVVVLSMIMFFLGNTICIDAFDLQGKIHKNVYVENLNLSGFTKDEAKVELNKLISQNDELRLSYGEKIYSIKLSELNIKYNTDEVIEQAYNVGRVDGVISNLKTRIKLNMGDIHTIKLKYSYDVKSIENFISYIQKEIDKEPISATIKVENNSIVLSKETYGMKVDTSKLKEILINKAQNIFYKEDKIPVSTVKPLHIHEELSKINTVLGTFETRFSKSTQGRVNNIYVAAQATSNVLINPYEEFSFNKHASGSEFISRLKEAPVIRNGKLEDGLGGGICQVSTTIYNAALYAGLEITNVRNHSIPSSYIEKGRDATVSSGELDLRFKNNFDTPILIYNKVDGDKIISTIYGNEADKKDIEIVTEIVNKYPNKTKYIDSDRLYIGQEEVWKKGRVGYKVNTFRIYKNQNETKKELIFESYYPPMVEERLQGTKQKEVKPKQSNTPKNEPNNQDNINNKHQDNLDKIKNIKTEII